MRKKRHVPFYLLLGLLAVAPAFAVPKTVNVNCDIGDSIMDALSKKGDPLTIEISGICVEDVVVRRDNVSFVGTDPSLDGVQAATNTEPFSAAVTVREARNISFENLQFSGGATAGLRVENSRRNVFVDTCLFLNNGTWGLIAVGSTVEVDNSVIRDNATSGEGGGLRITESGRIDCNGCTINNNPDETDGSALSARRGGIISIANSNVAGSQIGALATDGAQVSITSSNLAADSAVVATSHASAVLTDSFVWGEYFIADKSRLKLTDTVQVTSNFNTLLSDSYLEVSSSAPGASSLAANLTIDSFSEGRSFGQPDFLALFCSASADFQCSGGETKTGSTCGLCP